MALPTSTWEMLGLQNGLEEDDFPQLPPLSVENVDDENCSWALRWMGNQISMLQANFPGKSLVEVAQRLLEQRDPVKYVQTLDFKPDWVSCGPCSRMPSSQTARTACGNGSLNWK